MLFVVGQDGFVLAVTVDDPDAAAAGPVRIARPARSWETCGLAAAHAAAAAASGWCPVSSAVIWSADSAATAHVGVRSSKGPCDGGTDADSGPMSNRESGPPRPSNIESGSPQPATSHGSTPPGYVPHWPTNASGETYGSAIDGQFPGDVPDLIQAYTTDWKIGYVRRSELDVASGAPGVVVKTPADALEWNKKVAARAAAGERTFVQVYEQDGVTIIGRFELGSNPSRPPL